MGFRFILRNPRSNIKVSFHTKKGVFLSPGRIGLSVLSPSDLVPGLQQWMERSHVSLWGDPLGSRTGCVREQRGGSVTGMTLSHLLDQRLLRTQEVQEGAKCPGFSPSLWPWVPDQRKRQTCSLSLSKIPEQEVPLSGGLGAKCSGPPHSILPGFIRPRGSSVALSCHMVSMPTVPTSSCSSCRLPSPMPCSPVHVPRSASARLGGRGREILSGELLPLCSSPRSSLARVYSYLPSWCANTSTLWIWSASSGSTSRRQWKLPSPTCPTMAPTGPEDRAAIPSPAFQPPPRRAPAVGRHNL